MNNDDFTVLVSGGSRCCWVSMCTVCLLHSKLLCKDSKESASNFALRLNIPPWKLSRWFRRLQLWATVDWQLHHNNIPGHASRLMQSFLVKRQITQVTQSLNNPDSVPCNSWLFPKLKLPLKGTRFQTIDEIQENMMGQWMEIGRIVWGPKVCTLKGI